MPPSAESFLKAAIASNGKAISLLTSHQHLRPIQQKDAEAIADVGTVCFINPRSNLVHRVDLFSFFQNGKNLSAPTTLINSILRG